MTEVKLPAKLRMMRDPMTEKNPAMSTEETTALVLLLNEVMADFMEIYQRRGGTVVIDAQPLAKQLMLEDHSLQTVRFAPAQMVARFALPDGAKRITRLSRVMQKEVLLLDTDAMACEAIDSLLEGRRLFEGLPNWRVHSGIYKVSEDMYAAGRLLVLEASYGRFLVGFGDEFIVSDYLADTEHILMAVAYILTQLFPDDGHLLRSYAWLARNGCHLPQRRVEVLETLIDARFEKKAACLSEYFAYLERSSVEKRYPFRELME